MLGKFKETKKKACVLGAPEKEEGNQKGGRCAGHLLSDFVSQGEGEYALCPEREMKTLQGKARAGHEKRSVKKMTLVGGLRKDYVEAKLNHGDQTDPMLLLKQQRKCLELQEKQLLSTLGSQKPTSPFLAEW